MYFDTSYINTMFTGCHIVSAASSPGRHEHCGCVGAWAKHCVCWQQKYFEKQVETKKTAAQRIEVTKGKYARTCVCLTKKTTDLKRFMLRLN